MLWPRKLHPAGVALHVIQRGNARAACFYDERDYAAYRNWLRGHAERFECSVHAYALMGNHVHLLLTASCGKGTASLMQALADCHARYMLEAHDRTGALWEDGFEASPVHVRRHVLACMRYIELNPVMARLTRRPEDYRWSSYRANALGHEDALVIPHPCYYALGRSAEARRVVYRDSFEAASVASLKH